MTATTTSQRLEAVDALRGFALAGILITHMLEQYIAAPRPPLVWTVEPSTLDGIIMGAGFILLTGKFFSIFALLFGVSFGIMMRSAAQRGENFSGRFIWRVVLLLLFGAIHTLFYRGDILAVYALLGLILPLFYPLSNRLLLIMAGCLLLGLGRFGFLLIADQSTLLPYELEPDDPAIINYVSLLRDGSLWQVMQANFLHGFHFKYDFQFAIYGRGYVTLALFFVGVILVRIGFFDHLTYFKPHIKKVLKYSLISLVVSIGAMAFTFSLLPKPVDRGTWGFALGFTFYDLINTSLTSIYICLFLLIYLGKGASIVNRLAPYGRMALTHYLLQSALGTAFFYGWGLGFLGKLHDWQTLCLGVILLSTQVYVSRLWLNRFYYGPLEWLWRCGTYGRRIKLTRSTVS